MIEVIERHVDRGLVLPPMARVGPLEEHPVVALLGHDRRRALHALVRPPVEDKGPGLLLRLDAEHDDLLVAPRKVHVFDIHRRGRLEAVEHRRDLAPRLVRDLLADDLPIVSDADDHLATLAVEEGAERLASGAELRGRALQLKRLGLAGGDLVIEVTHQRIRTAVSGRSTLQCGRCC